MSRLSGAPPTRAQVEGFQEIGRRLDQKGMIAANDGNLSCRDGSTLLVTATGSNKGSLRADEVVRVDLEGRLLAGARPPSSEMSMHLALYRLRPDIGSVVHAHPVTATGFAVARRPLDQCVLPEIILTLGSVPIAPYGTPGTDELAASLASVARTHDVFLLANHGAVALGATLEEAYYRMERLEHTARILLVSHLLGHTERLGTEEVQRLMATGPEERRSVVPCRTDDEFERLRAIVAEVLRARGF